MQEKNRKLTVEELPKELTEEQLNWVTGGSAMVTGTNRGTRSFHSDDSGHHNVIQH
jgi:hypothetical protein